MRQTEEAKRIEAGRREAERQAGEARKAEEVRKAGLARIKAAARKAEAERLEAARKAEAARIAAEEKLPWEPEHFGCSRAKQLLKQRAIKKDARRATEAKSCFRSTAN